MDGGYEGRKRLTLEAIEAQEEERCISKAHCFVGMIDDNNRQSSEFD